MTTQHDHSHCEILAQTRLDWSFVHDLGNLFTYIGQIKEIIDVHVEAWRQPKDEKCHHPSTDYTCLLSAQWKVSITWGERTIIALNKTKNVSFNYSSQMSCFYTYLHFQCYWVFFITRHRMENQLAHNESKLTCRKITTQELQNRSGHLIVLSEGDKYFGLPDSVIHAPN